MPEINKLAHTLFLLFLLVAPLPSKSDVNSVDIISQAANLECTDYCVIGACFWLVCKLFSCDVETSLKVAHNRPDVVVSAHAQPGQSAWTEGRSIFGSFAYSAGSVTSGGGILYGGGEDRNISASSPVKFRDVHIVGSPYAAVESSSMMCDSPVTPFMPYLLTELDSFSWRGVVERLLPQSYLPGYKEIGDWPSYTWGGIYPRIGFTAHTDPGKAASVAALRAMHIVQEGGFHLYQEFEQQTGQKDWEMISNGTPWQLRFPTKKNQCEALGSNNSASWTKEISSEDGKSAWIYWPRCKCCLDNSGIFLGSVEFGGRGLCLSGQ